ncbi:MAG: sigma-54-dependent Fis family transcriptional regulator [Gemmatimonadetes bacterium]|nr:sigma-54-dependent Fis family transcriptional regulator [Gemmatimonadota bacterium]MYB55042.1 sigma-54-dependent Fis family transcriptional regulator [Gemmatimonadota bacterium]
MQASSSPIAYTPFPGSVFVADSNPKNLANVTKILRENGCDEVVGATDGTIAEQLLKTQSLDVAIIDINMSGGMQLLNIAITLTPPLPVVIFTSYATVKQAVQAMRLGAVDYVVKPVDANDLLTAVHRALERKRVFDHVSDKRVEARTEFGELLGTSNAMEVVFNQIRRAAPFKSTVLITGESGTGKELVASAIHSLSAVSNGPFVAINCSALPVGLADSELFGHEKGSFTGATQDRQGLFEAAQEGTLFLDEIGDLEMQVQTKLLRVLEEQKVRHVGASQLIDINVRVVAASNMNLTTAVKMGRFREDLYYRLNVIHIPVPPLRARKSDIPLLVRVFAERFADQNGIAPVEIADRCLDRMAEYDWPGNVRELKNMVERLVIYAADGNRAIGEKDIESILPIDDRIASPEDAESQKSDFVPRRLDEAERKMILDTLRHTGGNRTQSAEILGISVRTLQRKITEYGVTPQKI